MRVAFVLFGCNYFFELYGNQICLALLDATFLLFFRVSGCCESSGQARMWV